MSSDEPLSWRRLLTFFIPLGISASLVTISHVIINSTLARSDQAEVVIASYALAGSLLAVTERPSTLLRQTCSALVRDRLSFQALIYVTKIFLAAVLLLGGAIVYTPIGTSIFKYLFGVDETLLKPVIQVYQILYVCQHLLCHTQYLSGRYYYKQQDQMADDRNDNSAGWHVFIISVLYME